VSPFATPLAQVSDADMSPMGFASMAPMQLPASAHRAGAMATGGSGGSAADDDAEMADGVPSLMRLNTEGSTYANGSVPSTPVPTSSPSPGLAPSAYQLQQQQLPGTPQLDPTPAYR
jgi:hypothetical protein